MSAPMDDTSTDWQQHLIDDDKRIGALLRASKRIAVLGIKVEAHQPAHYVPAYVQDAGFEIIPVPVYYPDVTEILGQAVYRKIADIPGDIDIVDVFRRSHRVPEHVDDIIAKKPK